jgi:formate dehydrogenase major subunit
MPKLDDGVNYSWLSIFDEMYKGNIKGFFAWGQNPACSGANANKVRTAMEKLDWMVNVNLFDSETGSFWKGPGKDPSKIKTEVFMLPCAASMEKEGSVTNSGRWSQWRYKAVDPPGDAMPDSEIMNALYRKVKSLYEAEEEDEAVFPDPIVKLKWDYGDNEHVDIHAVAKEINGYDLTTGKLLPSFTACKDDGTTSSGNWLYCASYTEAGNMAARRSKDDPSGIGLYSGWSWCWPVNRRIIYNRASVDLSGKPWDTDHPVITWTDGKWVGDVPDGGWPPMAQKDKTRLPFIMKPEGRARIFGMGLADGPFPEHYEPLECPVEKNLMSSQMINPAIKLWHEPGVGSDMDKAFSCDPRFPFVCTTYRVTEHWQTGLMTRNQPWLVEIHPQMFVEMSEELANLKDIKNGEKCRVKSARGEVETVAIVTKRFKPFKITGPDGRDTVIHQVGIP